MKKIILFMIICFGLVFCGCNTVNDYSTESSESIQSKDSITDNSIKFKTDKKTKTLYISGEGPIFQRKWVKFSSIVEKTVLPVRIVIEIGATLIDDYAFDNESDGLGDEGRNGLNKVKEVTIPNTVTQIGKEAFHNLISLESITIPDSVTWIGEGAFSECMSLRKIMLSSNIDELPKEIFYGCVSLKEITIPKSVKTIADDAFLLTDELTIKGYKGTAAEKYAEENGFKFVAVG